MGTSSIPSGSSGGLAPKYQKFTSSGTFTLPDGYGAAKPLLITIQVIGGGGGGAGSFTTTNNGNAVGVMTRTSYNGQGARTINGTALDRSANAVNASGGGSGGIAQTQMYLTSNLTITVGAAGTRSVNTVAYVTSNTTNTNNGQSPFTYFTGAVTGGTGGTTTAGSVSSAGGTGGVQNYQIYGNYDNQTTQLSASSSAGAGGTPSGTAGDATPLLGTLAGGSGSATAVFGSFGIGGIKTDGATSTGVEGTGGGFASVGAPGAVVITWWQ